MPCSTSNHSSPSSPSPTTSQIRIRAVGNLCGRFASPSFCELKNAHRRCGPTNDPSQDLRHTNTPVAVTNPPGTAVARKGSSQTEHGPLNSLAARKPCGLILRAQHSIQKLQYQQSSKRFETTDVVSLPPQARQQDSVHPLLRDTKNHVRGVFSSRAPTGPK